MAFCYDDLMISNPSIVIISLQNNFIDFGVRYLEASCRRAGIRCHVLWLFREPHDPIQDWEFVRVAEWIQIHEFDMVGIGVMSVHFDRAVKLTQCVKSKMTIPVVWGGVHSIIEPEKCLQYADFVCVGEGEETIVECGRRLAAGETLKGVQNLWYREGTATVKTSRILIDDLNSLASPDFNFDFHWHLENGQITPLTAAILKQEYPWSLRRHFVISSRGCPYDCTYCCNSALKRLLGHKLTMRFRTVDHFMLEIEGLITRYPFIQTFAIMDDSFFFKPKGWIEEFCDRFRKTGKTFGVLVHPKTVSRDRIEKLLNAGLIGIQMGLQSGSERVSRQIFNRPEPVSEFIDATRVLDQFKDRIHARTYDVIVDNPFQSEEEQAETIRVLASLKKPFLIDLFSLTLYPGTMLYEQVISSGKAVPSDLAAEGKDYIKYQPSMMNRLTWMTHNTPSSIVLFFLDHRKSLWCQLGFRLFDSIWEKRVRILLRSLKRAIKSKIFSSIRKSEY